MRQRGMSNMKKRLAAVLLTALLTVQLCQPVQAVGTSAAAAVLMDGGSGRILYAHNADQPMSIASITKIMTALVALEWGSLDRVYTVTGEDMAEGSSMYLKAGEQVTLEELLYGLMLSSGNDAALAVAHCVSGSVESFVAAMNEKAKALGMTNTSFANPNGLDDPAHFSTARDMAVLTRAALKREDFCRIVSTRSITIGQRTLVNHNKLLSWYEGCVGVKTGYTQSAGRTLVSAAQRDGQTLIAVTLKDSRDWEDHKALLDYGFSAFPQSVILTDTEPVAELPVKGGDLSTVAIQAETGISYPLAQGEQPEIRLELPEALTAPLTKGTVVGEAVAFLGDQEIGRTKLLCGADVALALGRPAA